MAAAGAILVRTLRLLEGMVKPGVSTAELDAAAERFIRSQGATPTFKGYSGFPGSICASPNSMVVHGIPGPYRLAEGDVISVDVGVTLDGWVADAARTFPVGKVSRDAQRLLDATERSLHAGVKMCVAGNRIGDISDAIEKVAEGCGLSIVRSLVGHGVGRSMHEDPQVPNYGKPKRGPKLQPGMTIAIEPMVNAGGAATRTLSDKWTIVTLDGSMAGHFEHTVAVTDAGPRVLTTL